MAVSSARGLANADHRNETSNLKQADKFASFDVNIRASNGRDLIEYREEVLSRPPQEQRSTRCLKPFFATEPIEHAEA